MINGSVWDAEVDTALKSLALSILSYTDYTDKANPVKKTCPVILRLAEKEFVIETFPSCVITSYGDKPDKARKINDGLQIVTNFDKTDWTKTLEDPARPYSLIYAVHLWSNTIKNNDELTRCWVENVPDVYGLTVTDSAGVQYVCNMFYKSTGTADLVRNKTERIFHKIYNYEVQVSVDNHNKVVKKVVTADSATVKKVGSY